MFFIVITSLYVFLQIETQKNSTILIFNNPQQSMLIADRFIK